MIVVFKQMRQKSKYEKIFKIILVLISACNKLINYIIEECTNMQQSNKKKIINASGLEVFERKHFVSLYSVLFDWALV